MSDPDPIVTDIKRTNGIAGAFEVSARVQYPDDDPVTARFVGSIYGGPIVVAMPSGAQTFVAQGVTDRIGSTLNPEWVRRFFGPRDAYY